MAKKKASGTVVRRWTCPVCTRCLSVEQAWSDSFFGQSKEQATSRAESELARTRLVHKSEGCVEPVGSLRRSWSCDVCGELVEVVLAFDEKAGLFSSSYSSKAAAERAADAQLSQRRETHTRSCARATPRTEPIQQAPARAREVETEERAARAVSSQPAKEAPRVQPSSRAAPVESMAAEETTLGAPCLAVIGMLVMVTSCCVVFPYGLYAWGALKEDGQLATTSFMIGLVGAALYAWAANRTTVRQTTSSLTESAPPERGSAEEGARSEAAEAVSPPAESQVSQLTAAPAQRRQVEISAGDAALSKGILSVFVYVARADRRLTADEVAVIREVMRAPTEVDLDALIQGIRPTATELSESFTLLKERLDLDRRRAVVEQCRAIARADGRVTPKEEERLREVEKGLLG